MEVDESQYKERIYIGCYDYEMISDPLSDVLTKSAINFLRSYGDSYPHCRRGYEGSWKLEKGSLYLTGFRTVLGGCSIKINDELITPMESSPVKATWFTGVLIIPLEGVTKEHLPHCPIFNSSKLYININKGDLCEIYLKEYAFDYDTEYIGLHGYKIIDKRLKAVKMREITEALMYQLLYSDEENTFLGGHCDFNKDTFIKDWYFFLEYAQECLRALYNSRKILKDNFDINLIHPDELFERQKQWVDLYDAYEGQEKVFFEPYWIPIQDDGYDYFLDSGWNPCSIFHVFFDQVRKPHYYRKTDLFKIECFDLIEDEKKHKIENMISSLNFNKIKKRIQKDKYKL